MIDYASLIPSHVQDIKPSGIRKFFDLVSSNPHAISLTVGEPDFVTPWHIRMAGIESLEKGKTYYKPIRTAGKISASIREYQLRLLHQTISSSDVLDNRERKVKYILQAVQAINSGEIRKNKDYYLELLENIFRNVFSKENCDSQTKTEFRKAICWVDEALYKSNDK